MNPSVVIVSIQPAGETFRLTLTKTGLNSAHLHEEEWDAGIGIGTPVVNDYDLSNIIVSGGTITCDGPRIFFSTVQINIHMGRNSLDLMISHSIISDGLIDLQMSDSNMRSLNQWLGECLFPSG